MAQKFNTSTPSGFSEFNPAQEQIRQHWVNTISRIFSQNGFAPIYTPIIERTENLLGKGGNPKEMYVLDRLLAEGTADKDKEKSRALRFDHTVPLALYVARNFNDITFPFKRQAIGPVFRGERAQKGRFRQFDQCDIDVIGNGSLSVLNDAMMPAIIIQIFQQLMPNHEFVVRINNRKILLGFFEGIGISGDKIKVALDIVDDLEKLSAEKIAAKFEAEGLTKEQGDKILEFVNVGVQNFESLQVISDNKLFQEGLSELEIVVKAMKSMGIDEKYFNIDLRIARGLDYYTGTVFETNLIGYEGIGSICSGGRYENLTGVFTGKDMPGVGISIGLTRLLSQLFEAGILEANKQNQTQICVINADDSAQVKALEIGGKLRESGFFVENYLEDKKLGKKFDYVDKMGITFAVVIGENEMSNKCVQVKNLETGKKEEVKESELIKYFKNL